MVQDIFILQAAKNIIISDGINIDPEEVEEILIQHPNIRDVCITSEEHKLLGEAQSRKLC